MPESKTPTRMLTDEHHEVLGKLDRLETIIEGLDGKKPAPADLADLASFFKRDFWTHFTKEEDALFPEMEKFMPRDAGPIGMMLVEHEDLRKTNKGMQAAIESYSKNAARAEAKEALWQHGLRFVHVLREHIDKEDGVLFKMADAHLDKAQLAKIGEQFTRIEASAAKQGAHPR